MIHLPKTVNAWGMPSFDEVFKNEVGCIGAQLLPLQNGLSQGSSVSDKKFSAMILGSSEKAGIIYARAGIFYTSVIAGCKCADDPTSVDELSEYCEVQIEITRETAEATVNLLV